MKKRLLCFTLALCLLFALFPIMKMTLNASANDDMVYAVAGGNLFFNPQSGKITGCDKTVTVAEIPAQIDGIAVTGIDAWAFADCGALTEVGIPASVNEIGENAFAYCDALTAIWVAEGNARYAADENGVLFTSEKTTLLRAGGAINGRYAVPEGVTAIADSAFDCCAALTEIVLPSSLRTVGNSAFFGCIGLTELTLPDQVTDIGEYAFFGCGGLKKLTVGSAVRTLGQYAFAVCTELTDVFWKGSAPQIGENAFCTHDGSEYIPIAPLTFYYIEGKDGWTRPTWNGFSTATWTPIVKPVEPTEPGVEPTEPSIEPTEPSVEPTKPSVEPTEPSAEPTEPTEPTEPEEIPSSNFKDVAKNAWYKESVDYAVAKGLMNGMGNNTFEPDTATNRAMLVTILWRYAGSPVDGTNGFMDVPNGQWFTQAVAWAAKNGIVTGVGNNKFDPEGKLTREQLATILFRYSKLQELDTSARAEFSKFEDGKKVQSWSKEAVQWAVAEGIIGGTSENGKLYLDPQGNATRAQVATILMRFIEKVLK